MPDMDIVLAKIGNIQRCLRRIKEATGFAPESLDDVDILKSILTNNLKDLEKFYSAVLNKYPPRQGLQAPRQGKN